MQTFYQKLFQTSSSQNNYLGALARVSQTNLDQMKILDGAPSWSSWEAPAA